MPRSRTPASIVRRSSVRLTAVIRPNQPTTNFSGRIPWRRRTSTGSPSKSHAGLELDPETHDGELLRRRDVEARPARPAPRGSRRSAGRRRARGSSRSRGRRASLRCRSSRGAHARGRCARRPGAAVPASKAAARPTAPALAVCVWTTSGRSFRIRRASRNAASASRTGESSRESPGSDTTSTPACSATKDIDASPRATSPATSVVSYPRSASPRARYVT